MLPNTYIILIMWFKRCYTVCMSIIYTIIVIRILFAKFYNYDIDINIIDINIDTVFKY